MKTLFCEITLSALWVAAGLALSASAQGTPNFTVDPANDRLWGNQWPTGGVVTVTLGESPGQIVGTAPVDDGGNWVLWDIGSYDIQPGMLVTADDGSTSIQHTVKFLAVSEVNIDNDTVGGVAEPWSSVQVVAVDMGTYQNRIRNVTADGSGNWFAGFASDVGSDPRMRRSTSRTGLADGPASRMTRRFRMARRTTSGASPSPISMLKRSATVSGEGSGRRAVS